MSSVTRNLSADSLMAFFPVAEPFKKKQEKKFTISIHLPATSYDHAVKIFSKFYI